MTWTRRYQPRQRPVLPVPGEDREVGYADPELTEEEYEEFEAEVARWEQESANGHWLCGLCGEVELAYQGLCIACQMERDEDIRF